MPIFKRLFSPKIPDPVSRSVTEINRRWWLKISEKVVGAIVYVDHPSADCLNWSFDDKGQGVMTLMNAGADAVREFSAIETAAPNEKKCVFLIGQTLSGMILESIRSTISGSSFEECIIFTPFPAAVHAFARSPKSTQSAGEVFSHIESCILQWMGNMAYRAEIISTPFAVVPFASSFFVTPAIKDLTSFIRIDSISPSSNRHEFLTSTRVGEEHVSPFPTMAEKDQIKMKMLCSILNSIFEGLQVREEIHTVGKISKIIAKEMDNFGPAKNRRKRCSAKASLLLVDRSLDLSSAISNNTDSLLDKIVRILPKFSENVECEVLVDLTSLCQSREYETGYSFVPGSFAQIKSRTCLQVHDSCVHSKPKQVFMEITRLLIEALDEENIDLNRNILKSSKELDKIYELVSLFRGKRKSIIKHRGILQQALALVQTALHERNVKMDKLTCIEKLLTQTLSDPELCLLELTHIIRTRKEKNLTIEDILLLLMFIFQDGSPFLDNILNADKLQGLLCEAMKEDDGSLDRFMQSKVGNNDMDNLDFVQEFFSKLRSLKDYYDGMKSYTSAFHTGDDVQRMQHRPMLKRIMEDIFDPKKPELPDIEYHSSGFGTMLKSSLGLFVNVSKPRPSDNPVLVVFVVGGISANEVKQIKEVVNAHKSNVNVIIGSTMLVRPPDILKHFLD